MLSPASSRLKPRSLWKTNQPPVTASCPPRWVTAGAQAVRAGSWGTLLGILPKMYSKRGEEKTTTSLLKPLALWDLLLENTLPVTQVSILPWSCSAVRAAGTLGCPLLLSAAGLLPGRFSPPTPVPGNNSLTPCLYVTPIALPLAKFLQSQQMAQLPAHVFVFTAHQQAFQRQLHP